MRKPPKPRSCSYGPLGAFDVRGSPARERQKSRRRGEDPPKAPRAFADPLAILSRDDPFATAREAAVPTDEYNADDGLTSLFCFPHRHVLRNLASLSIGAYSYTAARP